MPNYYQVPGYLSVSYLKSLTSTGQSIKLYPESLLFGNKVDCLITGDDITPYLPVPESAYKLAELYKDKRFPIQEQSGINMSFISRYMERSSKARLIFGTLIPK
jgi:hypothetical protein